MSVTVPCVVPFTNTEAPIIGSPDSSEITIPETDWFCAHADPILKTMHVNGMSNLSFISTLSLIS